MQKITNLKPNTIGKRKCEIILNEILIELNSAHLTRRVMSRYNKFRNGCTVLFEIRNKKWNRTFLTLWFQKNLKDLKNNTEYFPENIYSFLRNCIVAHYRTLVREYEK